jgi:hypothetical protein
MKKKPKKKNVSTTIHHDKALNCVFRITVPKNPKKKARVKLVKISAIRKRTRSR